MLLSDARPAAASFLRSGCPVVRQTVDECISACLEALNPERNADAPALRAEWQTRPDTDVLAKHAGEGKARLALADALSRRADEQLTRSAGEPNDIFRRLCVWQALIERFDSKALLRARSLVDVAVVRHHRECGSVRGSIVAIRRARG